MPLTPAPGKGPIFVMGSMGTGTTLLRLMLDSHEAIAIPPETGFMRAYKAQRFIPFKWSGRNWNKRLGWTDEEFDVELGAFYDRLFMRYADAHGKRRWGEKTPLHTWHWDAMARVFPDAVFVAIVRHPGASIASNMNRWKYGITRASDHFERYTRELLRMTAVQRRRTVLLRYEELLLQPEPVMRELLAWLGEEWSHAVLEHHKVQAGRGGNEVVEGRNRVTDPLDVSRISKWTRTLGPGRQERAQERFGRLVEFLGYSMTDPAVLEPINDRGGVLTGGAEIQARMQAFPDLDLMTRGEIPRFEHYYHPRTWTLEPPGALEQALAEAEKAKADAAAARLIPVSTKRHVLLLLPLPVRRGLHRAAGVVRRGTGSIRSR